MSVLLVDTVAPPAAPGGLTATVSGQQVTLAWSHEVARNLITNPSVEVDTAGWRTGTGNYWLNPGGTLSRSSGAPASLGAGGMYAYVSTPGTAASEGVETVISGTFSAGVTYTASVWLYRHVTRQRSLYFGYASADSVQLTTAAGTGLWVRHTVSWTPATTGTTAYFGIRTPIAVADLIEFDGALVCTGGPRDYFDGDSDGGAWTGTPHASTSSVTDATGYSVYRNGAFTYAGTARGYVDSPPIGTHSYTVTATGGGGESAHSSPATATVTLGIVVAASAAVPGLNATHTWYPAGGGPAVVLNPAPTGALPRVRLTGEIAGWGNPPPGEDRRTTPVGRVLAERVLRSGRHGKPLTYQGVVEARNDLELRNVTGALSGAFGDPNMGEGRMVVAPWDGRPAVEYTARVTGYDCPEAYPAMSALGRASRGFERSFTLQVHLSRGRMFSTVWRQVDAPAGQASLTVNVGGNAPTEPTITMYQDTPATDSVQSQGLRMEFFLLPSTEGLYIDFATRRISSINGNERRGYLDRAISSWWASGQVGLAPSAGGYPVSRMAGRGAWSIRWKDAWW